MQVPGDVSQPLVAFYLAGSIGEDYPLVSRSFHSEGDGELAATDVA